MALQFHPKVGTILICDYRTGFITPEMVKRRPVVVISPRLRRRDGLCTVVPLSHTPPTPPQNYHHELQLDRPLPKPWGSDRFWVKADMVATVSFDRLELIKLGKDQEGKRKHLNIQIKTEDLQGIRTCVLHALGMSPLTESSQ